MQHLVLRRHCERRLNALDRERASWFAHWRELSNNIMPRRGNFLDARFDGEGAKPRYANVRVEIWGSVKDWLEQRSVAPDLDLAAHLSGVEHDYNAKGEIQLEKKDDMKKRGLASPEIADAHLHPAGYPGLGPAAGAGVLRDRVRPLSRLPR